MNIWPEPLPALSADGPSAFTAEVRARADVQVLPLDGRDVIVQYTIADGLLLADIYRRLTPSGKWVYMTGGTAASQKQCSTAVLPVLMFRNRKTAMVALTTWKAFPADEENLDDAPDGSLATAAVSEAAHQDLLLAKQHGVWTDFEAGPKHTFRTGQLLRNYRAGLLWVAPTVGSGKGIQ